MGARAYNRYNVNVQDRASYRNSMYVEGFKFVTSNMIFVLAQKRVLANYTIQQ